MTVIAYYTRQVSLMRRNEAGQAAVLVLTTVSVILALGFGTVYTSYLGAEKVASSNAIDAIALSAATWEARGLNVIAALNDGILQCFRVIRYICATWASLAIAACLGAGMGAFVAYSKWAPEMIRSYWKTAKQLAEWAEKVKSLTPSLVLAETATLSNKFSVTGVLSPFDPRGPHDGDNTLELHLKRGAPLYLADALSPVTEIPGRIGKWKWAKNIAKAISGVIGFALGSILAGMDTSPIRMLEPEEDFPRRQKVRFAGYRESCALPIPYLEVRGKHRMFSESFAEPYGGGRAEMSWKSRLTDGVGK